MFCEAREDEGLVDYRAALRFDTIRLDRFRSQEKERTYGRPGEA